MGVAKVKLWLAVREVCRVEVVVDVGVYLGVHE
jgi:hypothetical protein